MDARRGSFSDALHEGSSNPSSTRSCKCGADGRKNPLATLPGGLSQMGREGGLILLAACCASQGAKERRLSGLSAGAGNPLEIQHLIRTLDEKKRLLAAKIRGGNELMASACTSHVFEGR